MLSSLADLALVFARPAAFSLALLLVPVILLYFLRMRFRRKEVGSTFIWRSLVQVTSGGETLKRRSILLLLLQMAAILAAAVAAAGPSLVSRRLLKPGVAVIIDVSASMATRDRPIEGAFGTSGETSRVEAAVREAMKEIDGLGDDVPIAVFSCADTARALLAEPVIDKAAAKAALRALVAGDAAFDEAACADAIAAVLDRRKGAWGAVVFTDGGLSLNGEALAAVFEGSVRFDAVGTRGTNLGVTGLRFEVSEEGGTRAAFSLWNGNVSPQEIETRLSRDGERLASARMIATPGWSRSDIALKEDVTEGAYTLEVVRNVGGSGPGGSFHLAVSGKRNFSVFLVGRKNPFITASLAHEGIAYTSAPSFPDFLSADSGDKGVDDLVPDIVISDSAAIPKGVPTGLVVFGAPPTDAPLAVSGRISGRIVAAEASLAHPLARFIDWEGAAAESSLSYAVHGEAVVLATIREKPVIVAWEKDGYRRLACGIDLSRSDFGLKSAFPVLLQNYLQWYAPKTDAQSVHTLIVGERARRLEDESFKVRGDSIEVERSGPAVFLTPREAGIFEWEASGERGFIAVNVPPSELDVAPHLIRPRAAKRIDEDGKDGSSISTAAALPIESSRQLGSPVSALFAALLAGEWLLWYGTSKRRPRSKKRRYEA